MTTVRLNSADPVSFDTDALIVGFRSGPEGPRPVTGAESLDAAFGGKLAASLSSMGFAGQAGEIAKLPTFGSVTAPLLVAVGLGDAADLEGLRRAAGAAVRSLAGTARAALLLPADSAAEAEAVALGALLGAYAFARYRTGDDQKAPVADLTVLSGAPAEAAERAAVLAGSVSLVRDLVNTPADDMGPAALAAAARKLAGRHGARCRVIVGDALLRENYPTIHAVGRAAAIPPRLIDLTWGRRDAPKVSLVGKGVCFDTGGLDLKTASGMLRMKKDMAGGAHVLGLAHMIMAAKLPVRLRVLIGAVENSVSGSSFHPADVIRTRKGITVEVGNTDAEGRLVMCDALAEADREKPALLANFSTLTGAARTAVGTELGALFCNDDSLAADLLAAGAAVGDPLWRLPLWRPYRRLLDSKVADICNVSDGPAAGAITAALYLNEFVSATTPWAHFDIMAWNVGAQPGRPVGGEAMGMRALYAVIEKRFNRRSQRR